MSETILYLTLTILVLSAAYSVAFRHRERIRREHEVARTYMIQLQRERLQTDRHPT